MVLWRSKKTINALWLKKILSSRAVLVLITVTIIGFTIFSEEDEHRKIVQITEEHILNYAMQGLRTLCMAKKVRNR